MIASLSAKNGYEFKGTKTILHEQALADDLSIVASSPEAAQLTPQRLRQRSVLGETFRETCEVFA